MAILKEGCSCGAYFMAEEGERISSVEYSAKALLEKWREIHAGNCSAYRLPEAKKGAA